MNQATPRGVSWQLGTPRLPTPRQYCCQLPGQREGICQLAPGAREGASGKAAPGAPVTPKPARHPALQLGLCVHSEAPQLGQRRQLCLPAPVSRPVAWSPRLSGTLWLHGGAHAAKR